MKLPAEFEKRMEKYLGAEYPQFRKSYERNPHQGLRVNTLKLSVREFQERSPFALRPVPWTAEGFYYGDPDRPGRHPWHEAGLYYIQEPSAMAAAALSGAVPGERILDLCAAPGGKTTQIAASMQGQGLLVSNEIHPGRAKILASNVERMGIRNAVVTNETPEQLAERFPAFFDRIIVDAPCSGEGMFRKEEQALLQWSPENVRLCAGRQQGILEQAARMLSPGGTLVYSTCTFAPEEDEGSVIAFLRRHPEFSVRRVKACESFAPGRPEWVEEAEALQAAAVRDTFRLWPHRLEGEGHYVAVLEKEGAAVELLAKECAASRPQKKKKAGRTEEKGGGRAGAATAEALQLFAEFARGSLKTVPEGVPALFGDQLYLLPCALELQGLKVLRAGLHLGTVKKNRFEPSHALALALRAEDVIQVCDYAADSDEIRAYLRGESLEAADGGGEAVKKGWTLVLAGGYSIGWGKLGGGTLKNHYPKGLRIMG